VAADDPEREVVAATFNDEWQAAIMRETLLSEGIPCVIAGGYTGSFRAEAPGRVKLLVRATDLARAEEAIRLRREEAAAIDWSTVDLGTRDPDDGEPDSDEDPPPPSRRT
jgi:hypothetical protein